MNGYIKSGCMLLMLWLLPSGVQAACNFVSGVSGEITGNISFGNVIVQRDMPVGSVIATRTVDYNNGGTIAGCDTPWTYRGELSKWSSLSTLGANIYNTNIQGVGIRITYVASRIAMPNEQNINANIYMAFSQGIKAELIKTGNITGGTLSTGMLARSSIVNEFYFANVTLNGTNNITSVACSVTNANINVPLGQRRKSDFTGVGSTTAWQTFNINMDCNKDARINVRIDATADSSAGAQGVMQLDNAPVMASGVGIQLWYQHENTPVRFGQERFYWTSPSGGVERVQLQARYYQTAETIIPGEANGTATFTLTYK